MSATTTLATIPVRSSSDPAVLYTVTVDGTGEATCTCPAFEHRPGPCKHARQVLADLAEVLPEVKVPDQPAPARAVPPRPAPAPGPADEGPTADEWMAAERALAQAGDDPEALAAARRALRVLEGREAMAAASHGATADLAVPGAELVPSPAWKAARRAEGVALLCGMTEAAQAARAELARLEAEGLHLIPARDLPPDPPPAPPAFELVERNPTSETWKRVRE